MKYSCVNAQFSLSACGCCVCACVLTCMYDKDLCAVTSVNPTESVYVCAFFCACVWVLYIKGIQRHPLQHNYPPVGCCIMSGIYLKL